jgi:hypothetical protein
MHATIEQLLAIRDREPVAARVKQHADHCLLCRERLDQMTLARDELNRLPALAPARDCWPDIQARMEICSAGTRQRARLARYAGLGLAASALLLASLYTRLSEDDAIVPQPDTQVAAQPATVPAGNPVSDAGQGSTDAPLLQDRTGPEPDLDTLIARSAYLEAVLHALPHRPRVARASTTDLITGLQDGVALVDYQLNRIDLDTPPHASRQLWQQRIDLMNSLVNVRYAEVQRVAYSPN